MPVQLFQIFLDKESSLPYHTGEPITGKFIIVVTDSYTHNGIYVKFEGHSMIKWTEEGSCFDHTAANAKQHRSRRQFFEAVFKYCSGPQVLDEGTHIFPFEYTLPSNLPCTLNTPIITVWYKLEVLLLKEHSVSKPRREVLIFKVQALLDLNKEEAEVVKGSLSEVKNLSFMCFHPPIFCSFHYTSVGLKIRKGGYIPGEAVPVNIAALTDCRFTFASLSLVQEIRVVTKEKTMIERRTLGKIQLGDLEEEDGDYKRWEEVLKVPEDAVVTTTAVNGDDVKVKYYLRFSAEAVKFPYKQIKIVIPIVVGTVPLQHVEEEEEEEEDISSGVMDTTEGGGNLNIDDPEVVEDQPHPLGEDPNVELHLAVVEHQEIPASLRGGEMIPNNEPEESPPFPPPPPPVVIMTLDQSPKKYAPTPEKQLKKSINKSSLSSATNSPKIVIKDDNLATALEQCMIQVTPRRTPKGVILPSSTNSTPNKTLVSIMKRTDTVGDSSSLSSTPNRKHLNVEAEATSGGGGGSNRSSRISTPVKFSITTSL